MTACKIAPETAKLAPTKAPTIFLGKRIFQITISSVVSTCPKSVLIIVSKEMSADPKSKLPIIAAAVNAKKTKSMTERNSLLFPVIFS